ncbi:MAG: SMC-Scp complex subunit ScpB [Absicoccus sp.]|uniref:Segregation and condensation protein B n=1 Tax=Absicoccus intestinalis TaxID=2926319 RepID=A0ABU4WMC8_9FIRM|nr:MULTISPECIES: SMC-Scp complex subunit ScpB [unclassified Absicoccus]MDX8416695.1 SMC-Scp complex subunit ScpB [Absicoccus sp. CLA-KB-P134]MDY3035236.1 SMC-Scp complex subunit ScpB [Absicoccus sp.]
MNNQKALIEGLIFLAGEDGLTIEQIQHALGQEDKQSIYKDMDTLKREYLRMDRGIELVEYAHRYKIVTKEFVYPYAETLFQQEKPVHLSQAALETLAIIAYRQPITRVEIEDIRGVGCEVMLKKLQARGLIETKSHLDTVGKPLLYTVTDAFLDAFQLETLDELPELPEHQQEDDLFHEE